MFPLRSYIIDEAEALFAMHDFVWLFKSLFLADNSNKYVILTYGR